LARKIINWDTWGSKGGGEILLIQWGGRNLQNLMIKGKRAKSVLSKGKERITL